MAILEFLKRVRFLFCECGKVWNKPNIRFSSHLLQKTIRKLFYNMSKINLKQVEEELDDLSIRILELMNEHIACKLNLERAVRSGCIDLAKTRYIQGKTQVSAMNIPTEDLVASKTVLLSTTEEGRHTFELKNEMLNENTDDSPKKNKQDPLKWFGILVPSNLRQGQAWFVKALDLSVQSANISADIVVSVEKFVKLLCTKNALIKG